MQDLTHMIMCKKKKRVFDDVGLDDSIDALNDLKQIKTAYDNHKYLKQNRTEGSHMNNLANEILILLNRLYANDKFVCSVTNCDNY